MCQDRGTQVLIRKTGLVKILLRLTHYFRFIAKSFSEIVWRLIVVCIHLILTRRPLLSSLCFPSHHLLFPLRSSIELVDTSMIFLKKFTGEAACFSRGARGLAEVVASDAAAAPSIINHVWRIPLFPGVFQEGPCGTAVLGDETRNLTCL